MNMNKALIKWKHKTLAAVLLVDRAEVVLFARGCGREVARWSFDVFQSYVADREDIEIAGRFVSAWELVKLDDGVWDALSRHGIYPTELYLPPS